MFWRTGEYKRRVQRHKIGPEFVAYRVTRTWPDQSPTPLP